MLSDAKARGEDEDSRASRRARDAHTDGRDTLEEGTTTAMYSSLKAMTEVLLPAPHGKRHCKHISHL